jgi:hypothetical protein
VVLKGAGGGPGARAGDRAVRVEDMRALRFPLAIRGLASVKDRVRMRGGAPTAGRPNHMPKR